MLEDAIRLCDQYVEDEGLRYDSLWFTLSMGEVQYLYSHSGLVRRTASWRSKPVTQKQQDLIRSIWHTLSRLPPFTYQAGDNNEPLTVETVLARCNRGSAADLITRVLDAGIS